MSSCRRQRDGIEGLLATTFGALLHCTPPIFGCTHVHCTAPRGALPCTSTPAPLPRSAPGDGRWQKIKGEEQMLEPGGCGAVADDEGRAPLVEDATMEVEVRGAVVAAKCTAMHRRTASRDPTHFKSGGRAARGGSPNCMQEILPEGRESRTARRGDGNPAPWRRPGG